MSRSCLGWLGTFLMAAASITAVAESHARIVRLSSVDGQVQMDRGNGGGLERAILNTPIVEGTRLVTGTDGLAEVEFENESALRLTGDSEIRFAQLLMSDTGAKINQIEMSKGLIYVDTVSKGEDTYRVKVGETSLLVQRDTLARVTATPDQVTVAVFRGDVQLENQAQPVSIHKKETLTLNLNKSAEYAVNNGTVAVRYDGWNKEREDYSKTYAENAGYGGPSRAYGLQDLNYYGSFMFANGYGYVWQPYGFAGSMLSWNPYSNGAWLFSPGFGYAWTSAYPWGWLPFHYGSWAFINGTGWAWVPGRGYNGLWYANNFVTVPRITRAPSGWTAAAPPAIPAKSAVPATVVVGGHSGNAVTVPGGRIPPNFASLVEGRAARRLAATNAVAKGPVFAAPNATAAHQASSGHVFAPRVMRPVAAAPGMGGIAGQPSGGIATVHTGMPTSAGHTSSAAVHK